MRKILALCLMFTLCLSFSAVAESSDVPMEFAFEGTWIQMPELGFELYLPSEWTEITLPQENIDQGLCYYAADEGEENVIIIEKFSNEATDIDALVAYLIENLAVEAKAYTIGDVDYAVFTVDDMNAIYYIPVPVDGISYGYAFYPASDPDFVTNYAEAIVSSVRSLSGTEVTDGGSGTPE